MQEFGDLPKDEREKKYKELYGKSLKQETETFNAEPLRYIREFGNAGEGIAPDKIIELQAQHKKAEEAVSVFTGDHPTARKAKAEPQEAKAEPQEGKGE
jgi:hypothetical protein